MDVLEENEIVDVFTWNKRVLNRAYNDLIEILLEKLAIEWKCGTNTLH